MNVNSVELLNDAGSEYTAGTKLHFKIRMKAKDYKGEFMVSLCELALFTMRFSPMC
jgi:hypothetical protein